MSRWLQGPPILLCGGLLQGIKQPEHEAAHSPQSNAEVKNAWIITFTYPVRFYVVMIRRHKDNFLFTFSLSLIKFIWSYKN
jgi:hypothetical protein